MLPPEKLAEKNCQFLLLMMLVTYLDRRW
uniref:Uncharacterized protein MANES_05G184100 n=1 Tax=Rhizophora mucronata TaxID=61149 RepID=A0A2P2JTD5_RHIMU